MKASILVLGVALWVCMMEENRSGDLALLTDRSLFSHQKTTPEKNTPTFTMTLKPVDNIDDIKLIRAQEIAMQLFKLVEDKNLIVAGKSESQLRDEVTNLAKGKFGVNEHWHKKIVRAGVNTMSIYPDNPVGRIIQEDDILFIDFGIVVDGWESDYAKTYVIGNDAKKIKLMKDVQRAWNQTFTWYHRQTSVKSSMLFQYVSDLAKQYGYKFGGEIAGHIVGKYPHEQPLDPKSLELDVHPTNHNDMSLLDANGNKRHWILEIHFVDEQNKIGAYMEQLL